MATAEKKTSKHTPGPWTFDGQHRRVSKNMAVICHVGDLCTDSQWEQDRANARLIAAAPDLLSACRIALEAIKDAHHGISTDDREATIEQAIAKAEGTAYPPPRARGQLRG